MHIVEEITSTDFVSKLKSKTLLLPKEGYLLVKGDCVIEHCKYQALHNIVFNDTVSISYSDISSIHNCIFENSLMIDFSNVQLTNAIVCSSISIYASNIMLGQSISTAMLLVNFSRICMDSVHIIINRVEWKHSTITYTFVDINILIDTLIVQNSRIHSEVRNSIITSNYICEDTHDNRNFKEIS